MLCGREDWEILWRSSLCGIQSKALDKWIAKVVVQAGRAALVETFCYGGG